jgi:two-component system cell cycle sensor histidine kinase/response regulator CckA
VLLLNHPSSRGVTTILVVDDERVSRRLATRIFSEQGYRLLEADGAVEALRVLSEAQVRIDLVVLDVVMPDCNGVELGKHVLQLWPGQRIMYMSAHSADAMQHGVPSSGVPYLLKPYTHDEALAKVREALGPSTT